MKTKLIVNLTRGNALCVGALADRPLRRMRGLLGRSGLPAGEGLLLRPAPAIHTAFMRFPIDAVFLDGDMRVVDIAARLRPWRVASNADARAVLELSAGECARRGVEVGHRLFLRERHAISAENMPAGVPATAASIWDVDGERSIIWPSRVIDGEVVRLHPLRVLVLSEDHHYRSVTSMLIGHRGCTVTTTANSTRVPELVTRDDVEVLVIDAERSPEEAESTAAAVGELPRSVGVVLVSDVGPFRGARASVLPKWGPFEDLFMAIERADEKRRGREARNGR